MFGRLILSVTTCFFIIIVTCDNSEHPESLDKKPEYSKIVHHIPQTNDEDSGNQGSEDHSELVEHHFLQPKILELNHDVPQSLYVEDTDTGLPKLDIIHKQKNNKRVEHFEKSETEGEDLSRKTEPKIELDVDVEVGADDLKMIQHLTDDHPDFDVLENSENKAELKNLKKVEMLRRSDRGSMEDEPALRPHYFVKNVPSPDMFEPLKTHALVEEEEEFVSQLVFVNSDSHPHVVHQHKDYPKVHSFVHDEM